MTSSETMTKYRVFVVISSASKSYTVWAWPRFPYYRLFALLFKHVLPVGHRAACQPQRRHDDAGQARQAGQHRRPIVKDLKNHSGGRVLRRLMRHEPLEVVGHRQPLG